MSRISPCTCHCTRCEFANSWVEHCNTCAFSGSQSITPPKPVAAAEKPLVYIDPRTEEPCKRCAGKGFMPPWPGSNGSVTCGVCHVEERDPIAPPAPQAAPKSQGLCDTTMTERFENKDCVCPTYKENLGPCAKFSEGGNGRCVYCDHDLSCHLVVGKRRVDAVLGSPVPHPEPAATAEYEKTKRCCTVCDAKKMCHVCGDVTDIACSDCRINFGVTVYVCSKKECRNRHEAKCYGNGSQLAAKDAVIAELEQQLSVLQEEKDAAWNEAIDVAIADISDEPDQDDQRIIIAIKENLELLKRPLPGGSK